MGKQSAIWTLLPQAGWQVPALILREDLAALQKQHKKLWDFPASACLHPRIPGALTQQVSLRDVLLTTSSVPGAERFSSLPHEASQAKGTKSSFLPRPHPQSPLGLLLSHNTAPTQTMSALPRSKGGHPLIGSTLPLETFLPRSCRVCLIMDLCPLQSRSHLRLAHAPTPKQQRMLGLTESNHRLHF